MSTATRGDKLRQSLIRRYGEEKGELVFLRMRGEASGPFAPGRALHDEHVAFAREAGVPPLTGPQRGTSPRGANNRR